MLHTTLPYLKEDGQILKGLVEHYQRLAGFTVRLPEDIPESPLENV